MLFKIFHTKLMIPLRDKDLTAVQYELDHLMPFHILPPSGNYIWGLELHCKILLTRKKIFQHGYIMTLENSCVFGHWKMQCLCWIYICVGAKSHIPFLLLEITLIPFLVTTSLPAEGGSEKLVSFTFKTLTGTSPSLHSYSTTPFILPCTAIALHFLLFNSEVLSTWTVFLIPPQMMRFTTSSWQNARPSPGSCLTTLTPFRSTFFSPPSLMQHLLFLLWPPCSARAADAPLSCHTHFFCSQSQMGHGKTLQLLHSNIASLQQWFKPYQITQHCIR